MYGVSLFSREDLDQWAQLLLAQRVPMTSEHDLDQPIQVTVKEAHVEPAADGHYRLRVIYDVPDDQVDQITKFRGMSVGFPKSLIEPSGGADSAIWVDPNHFSEAELKLAHERLVLGGFTPSAGFWFQLSEVPPATVIIQFVHELVVQLTWAVVTGRILSAVGLFTDRGTKTRFRFVREVGDEKIEAEIETSSRRSLKDALEALKELDTPGTYIREPTKKRWRKAGVGKRRRPKPVRRRQP